MKHDIVILGLSITSSWGNGHATTYRSLVRELHNLGHRVLFLERDVPWYAGNRDLPETDFARIELYSGLEELRHRHGDAIREAELVMVGSYVPKGGDAGEYVLDTARGITAFYDIDTPVTLAKLRRGDCEYLRPELIPRYDLYLSFTGGPVLDHLEDDLGAPMARPLYCSVDPTLYFPGENMLPVYDLGYMGTYSDDRQPALNALLVDPARHWPEGRFIVAGSRFPETFAWPTNIERIEHLPPAGHRRFYNTQRFTLNITRREMIEWGYSPSVRLFEAAACGVPIISDYWEGIDTFFEIGKEILISRSSGETFEYLTGISETERLRIAANARKRILDSHTAAYRAMELENYIWQAREKRKPNMKSVNFSGGMNLNKKYVL